MKFYKIKTFIASTLILSFVLSLFLGISSFSASAKTNQAGSYTLYGNYNTGDGLVEGYSNKFRITASSEVFKDDSSATTHYNGHVYDWTYMSFYIHTDDIKEHKSFTLTRNGETYSYVPLSGNSSQSLFSGALPDGSYILTYIGTYKTNLIVTKTYSFSYSFVIDTTPPSYTLKSGGVTAKNGDYVRFDLTYSITDTQANTKIYYSSPSNAKFQSTTEKSKTIVANNTVNGWWEFYSSDGYQTSEIIKVYLDTIKPVGTITNTLGQKVISGGYSRMPIKYSATDAGGLDRYQIKTPGSSSWTLYSAGTVFSTIGTYSFRVIDKAGNISLVSTVTYDPTVPTAKLYAGSTEIASGGATNADYIKFVPDVQNGETIRCFVEMPGNNDYIDYVAGTELSAEGLYKFFCADEANNTSDIYRIRIDRGRPITLLYADDEPAYESPINAKYIYYRGVDGASGIDAFYVRMPTSNTFIEYIEKAQLSGEGTYTFYCVDKAGNKSEYKTICLDRTPPTGRIVNQDSETISSAYTSADSIAFIAQDNIATEYLYVKKPNSTSFERYNSDFLSEEGTYSFYASDGADNISETYTITVDRQTPSAQLYADGQKVDTNSYTNGNYISFESDGNCFVKTPDSNDFISYVSKTEFYKPGRYIFYALSNSEVNTGYFEIIIDRTEKTVSLSNVVDGTTDSDVIISWVDGDAESVAPIKTVTINGIPCVNGETIYTMDTGTYDITILDAAGNVSNTVFSSTKKNVLTTTLQKEYYEAFDTNGDYYAFASYENALAFAIARESSYIRIGEWKSEKWDTGIAMDSIDSVNATNGEYFIYKKSDNPDEWVAYFTEKRLNQVVSEYAKIGINSYYYWEKSPAPIASGEKLYTLSDSKNILSNSVQLCENINATLNGEIVDGNIINTEGKHLLVLSDNWGNTCEYNLTIVRRTPTLHYIVGDGSQNTVTFDRVYRFTDKVIISISDDLDEMAMFSLYDSDGVLIGHFNVGDARTLIESGTYTAVSINHAGKSEIFTIIISRNAPTVTIVENKEEKQLNINIAESEDDESHIKTLEIFKSTDNGNTWMLLEKDDYGMPISLDTRSYSFRTSGSYKAVVTDEFRTGIDAIVEETNYIQAAPTVVLTGVENGGYTNGIVTFEWTDDAIVTITKDGAEIEYKSGDELKADGVYFISVKNYNGYEGIYSFTIDTIAPEIKLTGVTNNGSINTDVFITLNENNISAELFKNEKSLGNYISDTAIIDSGNYKIVVKDKANNISTAEFTIDKIVSYAININDKGLSNSVIITAAEPLTVSLFKNSEEIEYTLCTALTEPGNYTLTVTDALGNSEKTTFTIVEPLVKEFIYNFDDVVGFEKVMIGDTEIRLNYGTLELTNDGMYKVDVIVNSNTYSFTTTVDGTAPSLVLQGVENGGSTKESVTITEPSEDATVAVFFNGEAVEYTLGSPLTEAGEYKISVKDKVGNTSEYTFTIDEGLHGGIIALLIIIPLVVAFTVIFIILKRKGIIR